jgi:phosphoglycolate phosphatase-like HAD superfamily hydrolase
MAEAKRVNTVLFDLDDTLLDSYRARIQALQEVLNRAHITKCTAGKFLGDLQGAPFQDALARLAAEQDIKDDLFTRYRHIYWVEQLGNVRLFPGIELLLDELKSRGYKLGIVTSKFRDSAFEDRRIGCVYELAEVGIAHIFSVVVGLEDVSRHKPHPDGIHLALERLGSRSGETLFVGDSAADIRAAHSAGCRSCLATWGITANNPPLEVKPHFIIKKPRELLGLDSW